MKKLLTMMVAAFFGCTLFGALTDGLVAYYKFDGNANDSSGNGNNGVVHGATLTTDRLGKVDGAYSFDGDDWVQVANSDSLSLPTKTMSFCVWMRTEVDDGWIPFLSKGTYTRQYGFELGYGNETTLFINDYNGTGCGRDVFVAVDSVSLNSGAWHFVVLTYDGSEIKAYVNGNLIASRSVEDSFGVNSSDLYIGKDMPETTEYFSGAMDDLRIYNRALSAAEVKALYEGDGLVAHYKFDGNANDSSGNGYDLAAVGNPMLTMDRNGIQASAYSFDGQGQKLYREEEGSGEERIVHDSFTISVWCQTDVALSSKGTASGLWNAGNYVFYPSCDTDNNAGYGIKVGVDGVEVVEHSTMYMPTVLAYSSDIGSRWNHIVVTLSDNGKPMLYVNGVFVKMGSETEYKKRIGISGIGGGDWGYYTGKVDDVRIYNRALSAAEVKALFLNNRMRIKLYVDDKDYIKIQNGEIWLEHKAREVAPGLYTALPGRHDGNNYATYINDESWFPEWGTDEVSSPVDCESRHKSIAGVNMPLSRAYVYTIKPLNARNVVKISETPTERNGNMLSVEVDDGESIGGAAWYEFEIAWELLEAELCTVTFDAEGGTAGWTQGEVAEGAAVGALPTATRAGYEFLGWFTAAVGGMQVTAATVVTADVTFYAHWTPIEYDISYLYLKGSENPNPATYTIEDELTFTALSDILGWTFVGWSLDGISLGSIGDKTVLARWTPVTYGISYAGVKGGANPNPTSYTIEDAITFTALSDVMGYRFAGWSPRGIEVGTTGNKTITAQYEPIRYAITYVNTMGAANPNPTSYTIEDAVTFAALPDVEGWRFVGWSFAGISRGNTGDVTVSANWEAIAPSVIPDEEDPMDAGVANTYDGIIMDADGLPVGYISIKAGKASGKGAVGTSKVTATIQMVGEAKKVTVKGNVNVSEATFVQPAPDGRVLDLMFTRNSIFGTFDGYEIEGVRNILASTAKGDKGSEAKQRAEAIYGRLKGNYVMAYGDENGWNGLSVSVAAKGKVKVSGKLADGTSVATSTQLIVGEDYSCIPVIYTKKDVSLAFSIYFSNDGGELSVFGYYDAVISRVTALGGECAFCLDGDPYGIFEEAGYELVEEFLPWEVPVAPKGTKWIVADGAKAGQIKMDKDGEVYDKKESDNPSGLKLTFTAKTGLFKGSFKVYAIDAKGKLKSFSATVNGIVVDGIGYGTVTIKKIGSVPVAIE